MYIPAEKFPETPAGKAPEVKVTFVAGGVPGLNVYNIDVDTYELNMINKT